MPAFQSGDESNTHQDAPDPFEGTVDKFEYL